MVQVIIQNHMLNLADIYTYRHVGSKNMVGGTFEYTDPSMQNMILILLMFNTCKKY